ncbi:SusC/RagA family TonB-linked outer membrane protein [Christiangramia marina]|uniref:SusC/RagA family TonB-linked outer membrane protein n=1 Tax=Christiangramia marina TaxID=409436 RepID=UPI003AA89597
MYSKKHNSKLRNVLFIFLSFLSFQLMAQEITVTGTVTDVDGAPIPTVNVIEEGTSNGVITDFDGNFEIVVPAESTLTFSFVGYSSKSVEVNNQSTINVSLASDQEALDEVVVIGYGEARKKEVTSSIATVDGDDLEKITTGNPAEALQGRASGVQVISQGGAPGAAPQILIRGITTFNNDKSPLIVVDGVMLPSGTNLNFLNPRDIKDFQILKDASASAIYGSRASNGVILITTKRGKFGKAVFTLDVSSGISNIERIDMANSQEYARVVNERRLNDGQEIKFTEEEISEFGNGTDWQKETLSDFALVQNYNLGISGGGENVKYLASLGYFEEQSHYQKGFRKKLTGRFNVDFQISDKLKLKQDLSPRFERWEDTPNLFYNTLRIEPLTDVYIPIEERDGRNEFSIYGRSGIGVPNPVATVSRVFGGINYFGLFTNTQLNYKPVEWLDLQTQFGFNFDTNRRDDFNPSFFIHPNEQNLINNVFRRITTNSDWVWNNTATYKNSFGEHDITFTAGLVLDEQRYNYVSAFREDIPGQTEELRYIDAATGENRSVGGNESVRTMFSYLGRLMYNFKDRYFLTGAVRRDASSVFPDENKWGTFPSISVGWSIADESFFNIDDIDALQLKAGYGQLGNQNINPASRFFGIGDSNYAFGGERVVTNTLNRFGNVDLKWETVEDINVGIEGAFFDNRLSLSVERYKRKSKDLLFQVEPPNYTGIPGTIAQNVGSMESEGWDASLGFSGGKNKFTYSINTNVSTNESRLQDIAPGIEELLGQQRSDLGNRFLKISRPGEIAGLFYGYESSGLFQNQTEINSHSGETGSLLQPNAVPGDLRFVDKNQDGVLNDDDLTIIGNPFPDFTAGLNMDFTYGNWDMSMQWYGVFGNDIINYTNLFGYSALNDVNVRAGALDRVWREDNPGADFPRLSALDRNQNYQRPSDLLVEDGSFVRLKNLQVGYNIPLEGVNKLRISISAQNLFTITDYSGFDPEVSAGGDVINGYGVDYASYPLTRTFLAGLNFSL